MPRLYAFCISDMSTGVPPGSRCHSFSGYLWSPCSLGGQSGGEGAQDTDLCVQLTHLLREEGGAQDLGVHSLLPRGSQCSPPCSWWSEAEGVKNHPPPLPSSHQAQEHRSVFISDVSSTHPGSEWVWLVCSLP